MIKWLDNSRIFAIFAVVFVHVSGIVVLGNKVGSEYWWSGNIYDSIARWCVSVFVMISGALLLDPNKKETLSTFYKKRLVRILWPLIFWTIFFLLWKIVEGHITGTPVSIKTLAELLLSGQPKYHMWFLYMILGLYLFTPFFRKIVANSSKPELLFLVLAMFLIAAVNSVYNFLYPASGPALFINWFLSFTPYFILGHIIRQTEIQPSKLVLWVVFGVSFIATALGCYFVSSLTDLNKGLYFYDYLSVTVIPMSISIMFLLKTWEKPIYNVAVTQKLASLTLGIYLVHPIFIDLLNNLKIGVTSFNPFISIPATFILVYVTALIVAWGISQVPYLKRII